MTKKWNIISLIFVLLLASCSKVEEMDNRTQRLDENTEEMTETTKKVVELTEQLYALTALMYQTMGNMDEQMGSMNSRVGSMNGTTDELYDLTTYVHPQLRSKESEDTRAKKMAVILNEEAGLGQKVVSSVIYMQSFEYQYWVDNGTYDDKYTREVLIHDGVDELFGRLLDIWEQVDFKKLSPMKNKPSKYNYEMAMMALGYGLDYNHYIQKALKRERKENFELLSMYDIITRAFLREKNNEEKSSYDDIILAGMNRQIAIDLLQARMKMATGMAINFGATNDKNMKAMTKAGAGLFIVTGGKTGKIKLYSRFEKENASTQRYVLLQLEKATNTANFLKSIGVTPKLDKEMSNIVRNLQTDRSKRFKEDANIQSYHSMIDQLRKY